MTPPRLDATPGAPLRGDEELLTAAGFTDVVALSHSADATVYRAVQPALARSVAVRLQHEPMRASGERRRFAEHCAVLGHLGGHPNILGVYGCDFGAQGRPYVVTELPTGETVAHRLQRGGWQWRDVVDVAIALAGALETAHRAGVVHGHVRPDHVLVSAYGRPQLADFAGVVADDPGAPAQDVRDLAALCAAAVHRADDVPDRLHRLLDEAQRGRFPTAAELGAALQDLQEEQGCDVTPLPLAVDPPTPPHQQAGSHRRRRIVASLLIAVLLLSGALAGVLARRSADPAPLLHVLGEGWQPDTALVEQLQAAPDAYLCRDPAGGADWSPTRIEAYTATGRPARVGIALHELSQQSAAAVLDDVAGQSACLEQLPGLTDVRASGLAIGGESVLLHYRRAAATAPVEIAVIVARRGAVVGQAVHLGYPATDPAVTAALQQALDDALRRAAR